MYFISQIYSRLDWFEFGVSSINRTGSFIACAMIACWSLCYIKKSFSFYISLITSSILGYYLILTQSRGALVAWAISFAILFFISEIKLSKLKIFFLSLGIIVGAIYSSNVGFSNRVSNMVTLESSSANVRLDIYLSGLKMVTDAIHGFNDSIDTPAKVYSTWYQNSYENENYLSMLNSHLEILSLYGLPITLSYILIWGIIFCTTFPSKKNIITSVSFCVWVCFFLTSMFSNVANYLVLWVIPCLFLILSIGINRSRFLSLKFYRNIFIIFTLSSSFILSISYLLVREADLKFVGDKVYIGNPKSVDILIWNPSIEVLGNKYGREIVEFHQKSKRDIFVSSDLDDKIYNTVFVSGNFSIDDVSKIKAKKYIFLNAIPDNEDLLETFIKGKDITIVLGDLSNWRNKMLWNSLREKFPSLNLKILSGVADYIPNWFIYSSDENAVLNHND